MQERSEKTFPDEWEAPKESSNPRGSAGAGRADRELFKDGGSKSQGQATSVQLQKQRLAAVRRFLNAFNEVSPLVGRASRSDIGPSELKKIVSELVALQTSFVSTVVKTWGIEQDDVNGRYLLSLVAKNVSDLIGNEVLNDGSDIHKLESMLSIISEFIEDRPYIGQLIDDNQLSDDVLVNVKVGLFPSTLGFYRVLRILGFSDESSHKWVRWHHNMSVNLAKDLAFNWDKSSSFRDREKLFETCLPHCTQIAQDVWIKELLDMASKKVRISSCDAVSLWSILEDFETSVKKCDMGYLNHEIYGMNWLKDEVCRGILDRSESILSLRQMNIDGRLLQALFCQNLCLQAASAWDLAANKSIESITEKLDKMSESEQEEWMLSEGSKPMPLHNFFVELDNDDSSSVFEDLVDINKSSLVKNAKGRLAMLWGISDAVCKIKRRTNEESSF